MPGRGRGAADRVVERARDLDTVAAVGDGDRACRVGADKIAGDGRVLGAAAAQVGALAGIGVNLGDHVGGEGVESIPRTRRSGH